MLGTIVNAVVIILGSLLGITLKKGIPESYKETILQGIGLVVLLIGLKMAFKANNELVVILALVLGGLLGEIMKLNYRLERFGEILQKKIGSKESDFVKGFVTSSLIFCVGAMAIIGAIESGLLGNHKILFVKSALDGITSIILSSSLGIGVLFSAIPVFIYQGAITVLASGLQAILIDPVIDYMTATGGLLIIGIGLNVLGIKNINAANLLPSIFIVIPIIFIALRFFPSYI